MELADVIGSVTSTVKAASLQNHKLLLVRRNDPTGDAESAAAEVAVDTVGAGPGDQVLVVRGSAARQSPETRATVTDATVVGIVDAVDLTTRNTTPRRRA